MPILPRKWIERVQTHLPHDQQSMPAWIITTHAETIIKQMMTGLDKNYEVNNGWAIHKTATIEDGATIKPPVIIGPRAFIASNAYLRGGVFLDEGSIVGPSCELKTTFMFRNSIIAHLSFVGDSIIGENVNIEAGAIIANYRNELKRKRLQILYEGNMIDTGVDKFGALVADGVRIGANAVIAPGALLEPGTTIGRLSLIDQYKDI